MTYIFGPFTTAVLNFFGLGPFWLLFIGTVVSLTGAILMSADKEALLATMVAITKTGGLKSSIKTRGLGRLRKGGIATLILGLVLVAVAFDGIGAAPLQYIVMGSGGPSVYQCFPPFTFYCASPSLGNNTNFCTGANVGTSSCSLPQNGCDGVLRAYGRCETGATTITLLANTITGATTVTFPTAFTNAPTVNDFSFGRTTGVVAVFFGAASVPLFSGNLTWFNVPQGAWTELFGKTDWEGQGSVYYDGFSRLALGIGCDNCTGSENFGLEWSSDQVVWHKLLNASITSIPYGGTTNSGVSGFVVPSAGNPPLAAWFRVTVNNQIGADESLVITNIYVEQEIMFVRLPSPSAATPITTTQFQLSVSVFTRLPGSQNFVISWKCYDAAG